MHASASAGTGHRLPGLISGLASRVVLASLHLQLPSRALVSTVPWAALLLVAALVRT